MAQGKREHRPAEGGLELRGAAVVDWPGKAGKADKSRILKAGVSELYLKVYRVSRTILSSMG